MADEASDTIMVAAYRKPGRMWWYSFVVKFLIVFSTLDIKMCRQWIWRPATHTKHSSVSHMVATADPAKSQTTVFTTLGIELEQWPLQFMTIMTRHDLYAGNINAK